MIANPQKIVNNFRKFCLDYGGEFINKYPEYVCIIKENLPKKLRKHNFHIYIKVHGEIPFHLLSFTYYKNQNKLKTRVVSFHSLLDIKEKDKKYHFVSTNPHIHISVEKDNKELGIYLNLGGVAIEDSKQIIFSDSYDIYLLPEVSYKKINNIYLISNCKDEELSVNCKKEPLYEFYFYTDNKRDNKLHNRAVFKYLYEQDKLFRELYMASQNFDYLELKEIDKLSNEIPNILRFIEGLSKYLETREEDLKKLIENGWKIILVSAQDDISRFYNVIARGVTDPKRKEVIISTGMLYPYSKKEVMWILAHEIKHALNRIEGKVVEGWWELEREYVPKGEEKEAEEYAKTIAKIIVRES